MFFMGWIWPHERGVGWWFSLKGSCFVDFLPRERWPQPAEVQAEIEGDLITSGELWLKEPPKLYGSPTKGSMGIWTLLGLRSLSLKYLETKEQGEGERSP